MLPTRAKPLGGLGRWVYPSGSCLLRQRGQANGVQKASFGGRNVQPPTRPILSCRANLVAQLADDLQRLSLARFKVQNLKPRVIKDCILSIHKVEVVAHAETLVLRCP